MESIKKYWLWGILISILSIFAMSHNANAVDFNLNFNEYENIRSLTYPSQYCSYAHNVWSNQGACRFNNTNGMTFYGLRFDSYEYKKGDIFQFILNSSDNFNLTISNWGVAGFSLSDLGYGSNNFTIDDIKILDNFNYSLEGDAFSFYCDNGTCSGTEDGELTNVYTKLYKITGHVLRDGTFPVGFQSAGSSIPLGSCLFNNTVGNSASCNLRIFNLNVYRYIGTAVNKEVEEKTQEAVDDSETAGGSSSQDAQTGTTGLLNAITGAVSVISSASPTNCKINGNMGNLDMGQLDLCANPAPAFIQTIGSLILILMCVPLAISLFNRFIAIFRSFQS